MKTELKEKAILLRKQGKTYSEILKEVVVAKSTLTIWLQSVGLSKKQKQRITKKRIEARLRGAASRKNQRISMTNEMFKKAQSDINGISRKELLIFGTALYWAEGAKAKENNISCGVNFSNSDYRMIKVFLIWLNRICKIDDKEIKFEIYIHENCMDKLSKVKKFWSEKTGFSVNNFNTVYFKKNKIKTNRKNTGDLYNGLLRVKVKSSSRLNRLISGWVNAICNKLGSGVIGNTPAFEAGNSRFEP